MSFVIRPVSPADPGPRALIAESHALMQARFAPEDCHALDAAALALPEVTFLAAEAAGRMLGCVALKRHADCAELKSFYVRATARGRGVGGALLARAEAAATAEGFEVLRLETGEGLDAAAALYARAGFVRCRAFADYADRPPSVFYEKRLITG